MNAAAMVRPADEDPIRPTIQELLRRAAIFRPTLARSAATTEANRRVSGEIMSSLNEAGLLQIMKPRNFGGWEYGPSAMLRVGVELGRGCGSTAWCAMIANCDAWFGSYWPWSAQQAVWGEADNLIATTAAPGGKAERVEGGYSIAGRWPFASNCENSHWCSVAAILPVEGDRPAGPGWFLTPSTTLDIDQESWRMAGLSGTGSKTLFTREAVFVPEDRMIRFSDIQAVTTPGVDLPHNPVARFGFTTFGATALVAPLLGMAQGALDWFVETMPTKQRIGSPPGSGSAAENPFAQERAGRAAALIDGALALLLRDLGSAERKIFAGEALDEDERITIRRDFAVAAGNAVAAVNLLFEGSGASAAALDVPIQRFWRDINAGAHHVSLDMQAIYAMAGQKLFGLPPKGAF